MAEIVVQEKIQVRPRNVSMYPQEWAVVHQVAKDMGLASVSAGLRRIVQEWQRLKHMEATMEQYLRLENAYRLGVITQNEFVEGLGLVAILGGNGGEQRMENGLTNRGE